jgi:hypothetical protein
LVGRDLSRPWLLELIQLGGDRPPQTKAVTGHRTPKCLFIKRARPCVHASDTRLIDHSDFQIVFYSNLTRQSYVVPEFSFHRQAVALQLAHLARVSIEHLDATRRAAGVTAASMQDIDAGVFNGQY